MRVIWLIFKDKKYILQIFQVLMETILHPNLIFLKFWFGYLKGEYYENIYLIVQFLKLNLHIT